jgi:AmiR/NasT family two-component response regulator
MYGRRRIDTVALVMSTADAPIALRVLIADGEGARMREVTASVASLGHEVIAHEAGLAEVGPATAKLKPDVAVVIVGESTEHALGMIDRIVREAACPVIAVLAVQDRAFVNEAARRGIFAYVTHEEDPGELQSSVDIVLRRFAEYHNLEGAFGRRALLERAKGILMERHSIDEHDAFEMLRQEARRNSRKIVDVAEAVLAAHRMLPGGKGADRD